MSTITDRIGPTTERLRDAALEAQDTARDVARERAVRAREVADDLWERSEGLRDEVEPVARGVARTTVDASRTVAGWFAILPGLAASGLTLLQRLLERLSEQGREVAATIEPPRHVRRRRAVRTAGWFAGGFTLGAVVGWVAHAQTRPERRGADADHGLGLLDAGDIPEHPEAGARTTVSPYGQEVQRRAR